MRAARADVLTKGTVQGEKKSDCSGEAWRPDPSGMRPWSDEERTPPRGPAPRPATHPSTGSTGSTGSMGSTGSTGSTGRCSLRDRAQNAWPVLLETIEVTHRRELWDGPEGARGSRRVLTRTWGRDRALARKQRPPAGSTGLTRQDRLPQGAEASEGAPGVGDGAPGHLVRATWCSSVHLTPV